jgi:hypothetical protein
MLPVFSWYRSPRMTFPIILTLVGFASAGCSIVPPTPAPKEEALSTLKSALEAWQKGETPDDVEKSALHISVTDPDWKEGKRLTKFEIDEEKEPHSVHDRKFFVKLWIGTGAEAPKVVKFSVLTKPVHCVVRDFQG